MHPVMLDKPAIAALIPHSGDMCLLDGVLSYDAERIRCISYSHRSATNPLRTEQGLPALCGIEYAAQAMGVHGSLTTPPAQKPQAGYLVGLRDVECHVARLDGEAELIVEAEKLMGDERRVMYAFRVLSGERELLRGRVTAVVAMEVGLESAPSPQPSIAANAGQAKT
jgi:predicted hotdog family 3-hydroxylacyl-ACP dehydratase